MRGVLGEFGEPLAEQAADQELGAAEVGLEDREREVQVLVARVVAVAGRGCCGRRDDAGGEVFDAGDLGADAGHGAVHEVGGPWEDVWARALRGPEAG